jgi:hypothetical protein
VAYNKEGVCDLYRFQVTITQIYFAKAKPWFSVRQMLADYRYLFLRQSKVLFGNFGKDPI